MKNLIAAAAFAGAALLVCAAPVAVQAWTIDFEDSFLDANQGWVYTQNGWKFQGRLIDDEFETAGRIGDSGDAWYDPTLTASFKAFKKITSPYASYERPAVLFDSTPDGDPNNEDPDLQAPFYNQSTGQWLNPGRILIIHEDPVWCRDANGAMVDFNYGQNPNVVSCDNPDDEYRGGRFEITFNKEIRLDSIDFFDIEEPQSADSEILLYDGDGNQILNHGPFYTPDTGGNNKWATLDFGGIEGVAKLVIGMAGSGAIDNIRGHKMMDPDPIPEPAALALFGFGVAGVMAVRRRRKKQDAEDAAED